MSCIMYSVQGDNWFTESHFLNYSKIYWGSTVTVMGKNQNLCERRMESSKLHKKAFPMSCHKCLSLQALLFGPCRRVWPCLTWFTDCHGRQLLGNVTSCYTSMQEVMSILRWCKFRSNRHRIANIFWSKGSDWGPPLWHTENKLVPPPGKKW